MLLISNRWRRGLECESTKTLAATRGVLLKKLFLKIPQYSQDNACVGVSLIKLQTFRLATSLKETPTQMFSCEYWNFKNTYFEKCKTYKSTTYFKIEFGTISSNKKVLFFSERNVWHHWKKFTEKYHLEVSYCPCL